VGWASLTELSRQWVVHQAGQDGTSQGCGVVGIDDKGRVAGYFR
jgi:hypothetical protein